MSSASSRAEGSAPRSCSRSEEAGESAATATPAVASGDLAAGPATLLTSTETPGAGAGEAALPTLASEGAEADRERPELSRTQSWSTGNEWSLQKSFLHCLQEALVAGVRRA